MKRALVPWLATLAWTCTRADEPPELRFQLALVARTAAGEPVRDTRFWVDGRELGATDRNGQLVVDLRAHEGERVTLWPACPPAFRTLTESRKLVLQKLARSPNTNGNDFEIVARCEPLQRIAALAVRLHGPAPAGLPIRVAGEVVGQTEADGTAHVFLKVQPNGALRVQLDTDAYPQLVPRNPTQRFELGDSDSIVLFEQSFSLAAPPRPQLPRRREPVPPPTRHLPYRIGPRGAARSPKHTSNFVGIAS